MPYDPADPERCASVADVKSDRNITGLDFDTDISDVLAATSFYLDDICGRPDPAIIPPVPRSDAVVWRLMVRRLVARWWDRRNSSVGIEGGFSDVPIYVRGVDPDIDARGSCRGGPAGGSPADTGTWVDVP